ncbi:hypothetical protein ACLI4Z_01130 [Natrialbaceae archaeon A-arb3/5]
MTSVVTAVRMTLRNRHSRAVALVSVLAYLAAYLSAIDKLRFGSTQFDVIVTERPLDRLFQQTFGSVMYEPLVLVRAGIATYQLSFNTVIGLVIGTLVGINIGISYLAWRQPAACGVGSQSAGILAGIPALLSGTACCAPVVVLLLGIQLTGTLLLFFELLLPIGVALLVGSLFVVSRQLDSPTSTQ